MRQIRLEYRYGGSVSCFEVNDLTLHTPLATWFAPAAETAGLKLIIFKIIIENAWLFSAKRREMNDCLDS